jgi:chromosome segregation protein
MEYKNSPYKKAEAERRLAAAQENIVRLKDIIAELEVRVEPLKIQSEKAKKFIELSEQKKVLEITVWVIQLNDLKQKLEELSEKILINTNEYNAVDSDIVRLEDELQKIYLDMQKSTVHIEELRNQILEAERSNTQLHSDIAVYENDILHSRNTVAEIKKQQENAKNSSEETVRYINEKLEIIKNIELAASTG